MRKFLLLTAITVVFFSLLTCKKNEEQPVPRVPIGQGPIMETPASIPGHGTTEQKVKFQIIVPPEVKEQWHSVKLLVEDKKLNKKQEFIVRTGEVFKIPNSRLTVKIGPFLPDFKMSGQIITSASNKQNNPTVGVIIYEDGKQIFPKSGEWGWLFARFPTIHSFQHERYSLILKEGIKK